MKLRVRMPVVLLVTYGGSHAATLAPVARELADRGRVATVSLALTTGAAVYRRHGVEPKGYRHYIDPKKDGDALALGDRLLRDVDTAATGVSLEESRAYLGLSMRDLIRCVGVSEAEHRYEASGRHAFLPRATLRRIISTENPDLVVATNSPRSERAAILEANAAGIRTLLMPDLFAILADETYRPFEAQWYAAMSPITRKNLIADSHVDPERIVVTGQPAFEKYTPHSADDALAYVSQFVPDAGSRSIVVVATGPDPNVRSTRVAPPNEHAQEVVRLLLSVAPRLPEVLFIIKPHPSESEAPYRKILGDSASFVVVPRSSDTDRLLQSSRGLLGATKTSTIFHAFALNVPSMMIKVTDRPDTWPYDDLEIPLTRGATDLSERLRRLLRTGEFSDQQRERREEFRSLCSRARSNVADLIEKLARL